MPVSKITTSSIDALGYGFKNRIINGAMMIDQRNAGASVTHSGSANLYTLDRWVCNSTGTPQFSIQQVSDAPAGFTNSTKLTTTTSGTPAAGDFSYFGQYIEGLNVADLGFGIASASSVAISFWVKCSLTGTFGGALRNSNNSRSYPFTYTISAANTWEQKTVTIAGDTTGTWLTTNGIGMGLMFDTGSGANNKGTAGAWSATANVGVTGGVNLVATSGATFYITGVQLEKGSTATSFDYRPYGTELALCQRYYWQGIPAGVGISNSSTTFARFQAKLPVTMRAAPTLTNGSNITFYDGLTTSAMSGTITTAYNTTDAIQFDSPASLSGLTSGRPIVPLMTSGGYFLISAEL